jgi:hypothetical protein
MDKFPMRYGFITDLLEEVSLGKCGVCMQMRLSLIGS